MSDSDLLEDEPSSVPAAVRNSAERANVESGSSKRGDEISNADQISLLNSSIETALKKQSDNFMQYLDARISQISKPAQPPSDEFSFRKEGNKIQFKFNSERSAKLTNFGVFTG